SLLRPWQRPRRRPGQPALSPSCVLASSGDASGYNPPDLRTEPLAQVPALVPRADHRSLPLVAELADRRGVEREQASGVRLQGDPAGGQDAQEVPVGEQQRVAARLTRTGEDAVGALADVVDRLAVRAAVVP